MALMDKVRSFMGYDDEDYEDEYEYEVEENRALAPRKAERARTEEMTMPAGSVTDWLRCNGQYAGCSGVRDHIHSHQSL